MTTLGPYISRRYPLPVFRFASVYLQGSMDGDVLAAQADEDVVAHLVQVAQASLVSNHGEK